MARRIDRAALFVLTTGSIYIFLLNAWGSIPLACAGAFVCMTMLRYLRAQTLLKRCACTAAQADATLRAIAFRPEKEAADMLEALIRKRYPHQFFTLLPLLRLPDASVSRGDVFAAWKTHRNVSVVVLAATCDADPRALAFAQELEAPKVVIADRRVLRNIMRKYGLPDGVGETPVRPLHVRLKSAFQRISTARVRPRTALFGLSLLSMYFVVGNVLYLFSALALLLAFGLSLVNRRARPELF